MLLSFDGFGHEIKKRSNRRPKADIVDLGMIESNVAFDSSRCYRVSILDPFRGLTWLAETGLSKDDM